MIDWLAASAASGFDVEAATRAYLDTLQGPARAQSDAYFEGGYWLVLWGALVALLADWLLLRFRLSAAFRNIGERVSQRRWIVTWITAFFYTLIAAIIMLPWTIYTGFAREKAYGLLDQGLGAWLGEQAMGLALSLVAGPLLIVAIYALIRRAPRRWWIWATGLTVAFAAFAMLISPVYVAPLFNDFAEMEEGPLRDRIEAVAARYDVPAEHIYVFDQSRQDKRISANVSGLGPTIRISLNDNLLERTGEDEVVAVMGHEIGHYVMGHNYAMIAIVSLLTAITFYAIARLIPRVIARCGERWGVRDIADPASIPLFGIAFTLAMFLATPVINNLVRWAENEADAFGLDAAREPDGFATVAMRLSEYRKIEPSAFEEFFFFDHPSGATRVRRAMAWKKAHDPDAAIVVPEGLSFGDE